MDAIAEIKSRLPIEDLVSQYVPLKRVGRTFKALCPFHKERTPSFHVNPERQLAYCFGCHKGGDHFKFIEEMEGLDFREALKFLAEKTGVELPTMPRENVVKKSERDRLVNLHEEAISYFEEQLWHTKEGEKVLGYLKRRGLTEETIRHAHLGFAPDLTDGLYSYLLKHDFTRDEILTGGLALARDMERGVCVDRFRMRLMFPIHNLTGSVCAFGGRAVKDGEEPKYLNSPETPIFHKSAFLYGLSEARAAVRTAGNVIVVEGYMDALSAHQAGFKNTVCCGGTALTEDQLAILKRFTKDVIFSFDRDNAGKQATLRAIDLALPQEFSVRVAVWESDAKDPDECIRTDATVYERALKDAKPSLGYLLEYFKEPYDLNTPEGKTHFVQAVIPFLNKIQSPVELDQWIQNTSIAVGVSHSALYDELKRFQGKQKKPFIRPRVATAQNLSEAPKSFTIAEYLLGLLLTYPESRGLANQLLAPEDFEDVELQNIYRTLTTDYNLSLEQLDEKTRQRASILVMYIESKMGDMAWDSVSIEVQNTLKALLKQNLDLQKRSLVAKIKTASHDEKGTLLEAYQDLLTRQSAL